jgi:hypothetical protein
MTMPTEASKRLGRRGEVVAVIVVYVVLLIAASGLPVLRGRVVLPADLAFFYYEPWAKVRPEGLRHASNALLSDPIVQFLPWDHYLGRRLNAGEMPVWNPHSFTGEPFIANIQTSVFFPLEIPLVRLLGAERAIGVIGLVCLLFGGFTLHWFSRARGLAFLPSLLGGAVFLLCGVMTAWFSYRNVRVLCFFPLLLLLADRLAKRRDVGSAAWLAIAVGASFFGGHIETSFYVVFATGCYFLARWCSETGSTWRALPTGMVVAVLVLVWAIAVAAVQMFPFVEALFLSDSFAIRSFRSTRDYFLPMKCLLTLVVPDAFGNPSKGHYWGPANWCEIAAYAGILPLLLSGLAALNAWRKRCNWLWVALALFSLAMTYGAPILFPSIVKLPGFSVSVNTRMILVFDVAVAILAAEGMALLQRHEISTRAIASLVVMAVIAAAVVSFRVFDHFFDSHSTETYIHLRRALDDCRVAVVTFLVASGASLALLSIAHRLRSGPLGALAFVIVAIDLVFFARGYNPAVVSSRILPDTPSLRWLRDHAIDATSGTPVRVRPIGATLPPNVATYFGLCDVRGYDPMVPKMCMDLDRAGKISDDQALAAQSWASPLLDLMGVRYLVAPIPIPELERTGRYQLVHASDLWIYENERALPRGFLASSWRVVADESARLEALASPDFDPRNEAFLSSEPSGPGPFATSGEAIGFASVTSDRPEEVRVKVAAGRPSLLVFTETRFPGWRVSVDARGEVDPLAVDHVFQGIIVPPGNHDVVFRFRSKSFVVGGWVSIFAVLVSAIALGVSMVRARRARRSAHPIVERVLATGH